MWCEQRFCTFTGLGFLASSILINLTALSIFAREKVAIPDGYILSTAFWLTASSSCVAFGVMSLLGLDALSTRGWKKGGPGITPKQRSLVIAWTIFLGVVMVGSVAFR